MKKQIISVLALSFLVFAGCGRVKKEAIRVMTLNVRFDNPQDSLYPWSKRVSQVCNFIKNEKPDILGLQEVLANQYSVLDSVLTDYGSVGVGRDDGAKEGEMNPIFFRKEKYDLVRTITFWLSETPGIAGSKGWGSSLPRIVTWLELVVKSNHEHVFIFNTHFAHDSDSARIQSSKLLLKEVDQISGEFPFIITGDFNMLPSDEGYSILTGPDESVPAMSDSYRISENKPTGPPFTYNAFSDKPGTERIDYIFVKKGLKVADHKTFIKKERGIFISDHWPVEAVVVFNRQTP